MADLYTRLKELKRLRESGAPAPAPAAPGPRAGLPTVSDPHSLRDPSPGADWRRIVPGVWEREERHVLAAVVGSHIEPLIGPYAGRNPVMLDVETSGLSGGAGSTAFLIGLGVPIGPDGDRATVGGASCGVVVRQLFLSEPAAEAALLERFAELLGDPEDAVYITYNGASFDLPVLRTRHILNRMRFPETAHWDLLPLTRRFYAPRIGSCTLGRVEAHILGLRREHDIPGSEVPERYHEFVASGDPHVIGDVVAHHSYDVAHLGLLAWTLNQVVQGAAPGEPAIDEPAADERVLSDPAVGDLSRAVTRADHLAVARFLLQRGGREELPRCAQLLDTVIAATSERRRQISGAVRGLGRRTQPSRSWTLSRRLRAIVARRLGETATEVDLRRELFEVRSTREDAEEYAKVLEHRLKDYAGAIDVINRWIASATSVAGTQAVDDELTHRLARLERRRRASARGFPSP